MLDGAKGVTIRYQLDTFGRRDRSTFVVAHFELADGSKLRDFDGKCRDAEGNVAQYQEHVAQYDSAHWESAWLFVPYDQLHMAQGKHQLRLLLRASDPPTNRTLA